MKYVITIFIIKASLIMTSTVYSMKQEEDKKEIVVHHKLHDAIAREKLFFKGVPERLKHLFTHAEPPAQAKPLSISLTSKPAEEKKEGFHPIETLEEKVEAKLVAKGEELIIEFATKKLEEEKHVLYDVLVYKVAPLTVTFLAGYLAARL